MRGSEVASNKSSNSHSSALSLAESSRYLRRFSPTSPAPSVGRTRQGMVRQADYAGYKYYHSNHAQAESPYRAGSQSSQRTKSTKSAADEEEIKNDNPFDTFDKE